MAWTQSDLDAVEAAIIAKATGKRVITSDLGGKDREMADTPLHQLRSLRNEIAAYLGVSTDAGTSRRSKTTIASNSW